MKHNMKKIIGLFTVMLLLLTGCGMPGKTQSYQNVDFAMGTVSSGGQRNEDRASSRDCQSRSWARAV